MAEADYALMMSILRAVQQGLADLRRDTMEGFARVDDRLQHLSERADRQVIRTDEGFAEMRVANRRVENLVRAVDKDNEAVRLEVADLKARVVALELLVHADRD